MLLSEKMEEELEGRMDRVMIFADHKAHWDTKGISCSIILVVWMSHTVTDRFVHGTSGDGMCPDWIGLLSEAQQETNGGKGR